jgi:hypothetical protein
MLFTVEVLADFTETKHFSDKEFLDINLTEDSCLLLHAIHSPIANFTENQTLFRGAILGHQFNLAEDLCLLLPAIHSSVYWRTENRILKKSRVYS